MPSQLTLMYDHVVHCASKYHKLINMLTNVSYVKHVLTSPLLIGTKKQRLPTPGQNVSQRTHVNAWCTEPKVISPKAETVLTNPL